MVCPCLFRSFRGRLRGVLVYGALVCGWCAVTVCGCLRLAMGQGVAAGPSARDRAHATPQWQAIQAHLPDWHTATAPELEMQADVLRARRFPEDAVDFYHYALDRGGDAPKLYNKLGLTEIEMRDQTMARTYFQRALKASRKDSDAWNNMGALEYIEGRPTEAISDYKRAIKIEKRTAVFHANLGTAYFETKDYKAARREIAAAMRLDAKIFEHESGDSGVVAHVLSSADRARFSFEMAKLYAHNGDEEAMMHSLAMASESGLDVQKEMRRDPEMAAWENDPRVLVLVHNAQSLRHGRDTASAAGVLPVAGVAEERKRLAE